MKLVSTSGDFKSSGGFLPDQPGEVKLRPEELEDLWSAYNLIAVGDTVGALTFRKVQKESSIGSVDSQRVKMMLSVRVVAIDFDPEGGELRLGGKTQTEAEGVRLGSHHTLTLELHRNFTLQKECWDSLYVGKLQEATAGPAETADVAAVLMQHGLANVALISGGMSLTRAKIEGNIPKKGSAAVMAGAKKARDKWFDNVLQAILTHIDFDKIKVVILAGPGFVKDDFQNWMFAEAQRRDLKMLSKSRSKWVVCHSSHAYKHALNEVLVDPTVTSRVADTKAAGEVVILKEFMSRLADQQDRVTYGFRHVWAAQEQGAIERLLISDNLLRVQHVAKRKQYVELVEAARGTGAKVHIFSSLHVSGEQLANLGGVAASLRFPLPEDELFDEGEDDDDGDDDSTDNVVLASHDVDTDAFL